MYPLRNATREGYLAVDPALLEVRAEEEGVKALTPEQRAASLTLQPLTLREAAAFVLTHHRHHAPPQGGLFAVGCSLDGVVVGAAIIGRPVARMNDDGWTAEVTRCTTTGAKNACSMLYRAAWRAARALGYRRLITYTLASESGVSLKACAFSCIGERGGGSWSRKGRPRVDSHPLGQKLLWEVRA